MEEAELRPGDHLAVGMLTFVVQTFREVDRSPLDDRRDRPGRAKQQSALAVT
jgi:hypothetical protein